DQVRRPWRGRVGDRGAHRPLAHGADDLELATLSWVHWYNHERIHSALDWVPPVEFERNYYDRHTTPDEQPLAG
ncbi:MAG TPA: integrase core domain-containing protein, partial [Mycobacterium sp.]